jgi:hypothetical protein
VVDFDVVELRFLDLGLLALLPDEVVRPRLFDAVDVVFLLVPVRDAVFLPLLADVLDTERERLPVLGAACVERERAREVDAAFDLLPERLPDDFDDTDLDRERGLDLLAFVLVLRLRVELPADFDFVVFGLAIVSK